MATKAQLNAAKALGIAAEQLDGLSTAEIDAILAENGHAGAAKANEAESVSGIGADPRTGKKITVRIENSSEPGGKEDVFASVNGHAINVKRGHWVDLDEGFVRHLESVEIADTEPVTDDNGKPTGELREVNRRRFQVTRK